MLYAVLGKPEEGVGKLHIANWCKLYLRSLALAGADFRLLWSGECICSDDLSIALKPLGPHFGPTADKCTAMLLCGSVTEACDRIGYPDECPDRNFVLTMWPASEIPKYLVESLNRYDAVFVPSSERDVFANSGVKNVVGLPWPRAMKEELERKWEKISVPGHVHRLLVVADGEQEVSAFAEAFIRKYSRSDGYGLLALVDDVGAVMESSFGAAAKQVPREEGPFVVIENVHTARPPDGLDKVLTPGTFSVDVTLVDISRNISPSWLAQRAESLGCDVLRPDFPAERYRGGIRWPGTSGRAMWRSVTVEQAEKLDLNALLVGKQEQQTRELLSGSAGRIIKETIEKTPKRARVISSFGVSCFGVVVPVSNDIDRDSLRSCLQSLRIAALPSDPIVVSVCSEGPVHADIVEMAASVDAHVCLTKTYSGWSIAQARNAGVRFLLETGHLSEENEKDRVTFVDADMTVQKGYLSYYKEQAESKPGIILTPLASDGSGVRMRAASGMSFVPLDAFVRAKGFYEKFVGWGPEDIDFLLRLRELYDIPTVVGLADTTGREINCIHKEHPPRADRIEAETRNQELYEKRSALIVKKEIVEENSDDWGAYETVI